MLCLFFYHKIPTAIAKYIWIVQTLSSLHCFWHNKYTKAQDLSREITVVNMYWNFLLSTSCSTCYLVTAITTVKSPAISMK
jgi:hypothetical protein